jgi:hypothetical protein
MVFPHYVQRASRALFEDPGKYLTEAKLAKCVTYTLNFTRHPAFIDPFM